MFQKSKSGSDFNNSQKVGEQIQVQIDENQVDFFSQLSKCSKWRFRKQQTVQTNLNRIGS